MIIEHSKNKQELKYLYNKFELYFKGKVDNGLFTSICGKFGLYIYNAYSKDGEIFLENFVKEYFRMRGGIVDLSDLTYRYIKSSEFKDESIINKIRIKHKLSELQKLCKKISAFEEEFYERTNISLLRVENERWAREQTKKEQAV